MAKLTGPIVKYPARISFFWYVGVILLGSLLLWHPVSTRQAERPISLLDAAFTATSATCVTGLAVRSTEFDFSLVGQLTILALMQLGGIGIMTVTTFVMFSLGSRQNLRQRALIAETLGADSGTDLRWILRGVLATTAVCEGVGFVLLAGRALVAGIPWPRAVWQSLFHAVSAFCNAGFSVHDDSLTRYRDDPLVNAVIMALVVIGGLGFPVVFDVRRNWRGRWSDRWNKLHLHSKLMLVGTLGMVLVQTTAFLILEQQTVLAGVAPWNQLQIALFHSVSCRTAGFNTIPIASLTNATLFVSILFMLVGAGPCSTAGGFKVSTVMVLLARSWSTFRGFVAVNVYRRTIPRKVVERATATATLFVAIACLALTSLLAIEQSTTPHHSMPGLFLDALFEVVSALGTVGLSTGFTADTSGPARLILIGLMFLGRLGPISVFIALSRSERPQPFEYPHEEPLVG